MKGILSRFTRSAAVERKSYDVGVPAIRHPSDLIVDCPASLRDTSERGKLARFWAFTGFGRQIKERIDIRDVNGDGFCCLTLRCGEGVACTVRATNGKIVASVAADVARDVTFDVNAGAYNLFWKEVV